MSFKLGKFPIKTFSNDFIRIKQSLLNKKNFAFSRFSDGEMWMMQKHGFELGPNGYSNYTEEDYKIFDPSNELHIGVGDHLLEAYKHQQSNYFCGLSCQCCVGKQNFRWMLQVSGKEDYMLTWANLFVNANYVRFVQEIMPIFQQRNVVLVARYNAVPENLPFRLIEAFEVTNNAAIENISLIEDMTNFISENKIENHVFLFAAGPLSNILIYELYKEFPNNTYLDIGSTLNPYLNLDIARGYLISGIQRLNIPITEKQKLSMAKCASHGVNEKVCVW